MSESELMFISVIAGIFTILGMSLAFMGSWIGFWLCITCAVIFVISERKLNH